MEKLVADVPILQCDYSNRGTWKNLSNHNVFWKQKIFKFFFFCKWTNNIQGLTMEPDLSGNNPQIHE